MSSSLRCCLCWKQRTSGVIAGGVDFLVPRWSYTHPPRVLTLDGVLIKRGRFKYPAKVGGKQREKGQFSKLKFSLDCVGREFLKFSRQSFWCRGKEAAHSSFGRGGITRPEIVKTTITHRKWRVINKTSAQRVNTTNGNKKAEFWLPRALK